MGPDLEALDALLDRAIQAARAGLWAECAQSYVEVAGALERSLPTSDLAFERLAKERLPLVWGAAAEAFRMADLPEPAVGAFMRVGAFGASGQSERWTHLASCFAELGRGPSALSAARRALRTAETPEELALAQDTALGIALGYGRKASARRHWQALAEDGTAGLSRAFREVQLLRLDGLLDDAHVALDQMQAGSPGLNEGGLRALEAAVSSERGELFALQGQVEEAEASLSRSEEFHDSVGRRGLALRAHVSRVRTLAAVGVVPMRHRLAEAAAYAQAGKLEVLALDTEIASGTLLAARGEDKAWPVLVRAMTRARDLGDRLRGGRSALALGELGRADAEAALREAVSLLADHVPLRARARLLYAKCVGDARGVKRAERALIAMRMPPR